MSTSAPVTTRTMSTAHLEKVMLLPRPLHPTTLLPHLHTTNPSLLTTRLNRKSATTSRPQATDSHRKPSRHLARSRTGRKSRATPVSSEDCDLLFLERSPHTVELAASIYVFIANPYNR